MKKLQFLILFSLIAGFVAAQNTFMLYSYKGNVSVVENKVTSKAKVGKMINANATIKVAAGSAVTLICNEAAMFTFAKAGNYALNKFGDSCRVSSNSVSANYVKYVWAQMTKSSGSAGSNRKAYMNTVGAVSRGGIHNVWVDPRLDTVNYSEGEFPLSWKSYADADKFEFRLYSHDNISTPIFSKIVSKLKIPITDFSSRMEVGNSYFWTASIKGEDSDDFKILNYVSKEDYILVESKLKTQGTAFEGKAEEAYRLGFMLEDAHFLAEALVQYTKAAALDTSNVLYRGTLMSFRKDYELK